jgi:hypothetical protein
LESPNVDTDIVDIHIHADSLEVGLLARALYRSYFPDIARFSAGQYTDE